MRTALALAFCTSLSINDRAAAETSPFADESDRINYSIGYQIGGDFKRQSQEIRSTLLVKGIEDALSGSKPLLTPAEMNLLLVDLKKRILVAEQRQKKELADSRVAEAHQHLTANAKNPGVVALPSGLQYRVLTAGSGRSPSKSDTVTVHYKGSLLDGTEIDSSYGEGRPASFRVDSVIAGWREALPLMKEGAKWELLLPPELAYGQRGPFANRALRFELELIAVEEPPAK